MQRLNLPTYSFNLKSEDQGHLIYDDFRRKWVALTPEEWVRQHILKYFTLELSYPAGLIATEMSISVKGLKRRCDIVVHNRFAHPVMIVECKAPGIQLNQSVFDQAAAYNRDLQVPYLLISNGMIHYCAELNLEKHSFTMLKSIPHYSELDAHSRAGN